MTWLLLILIINTSEIENNPFQLVAQDHISAAIEVLSELNQQGNITHQQLLLWARLKEQLAESDSAWAIYNHLSSYPDVSGYLSSRELEKWNIPVDFNPDTIYIIDSFYPDHYVRHLRIFLKRQQGIFYLDYNPFFSNPEVYRCTHQNETRGNFFRQKILPNTNFNTALSRLNFISSDPGNYVDIRIQNWDVSFPEIIEIDDLRPISYQLVQLTSDVNYHLVFQHFIGSNDQMTGSTDIPEQNQWSSGYPWILVSKFENWGELTDSLKQRIDLNQPGFLENQYDDQNNLPSFYSNLRTHYELIDIPLYRTHFFCRNIEYCLNHSEITSLEMAKLIYAILSPVYKVEIFLVSSEIPRTRYASSPSCYFERVMVRVDDSIWMDPQLNSPYGYLPGSFQQIPALNLYTGKLETLPTLPAKFSTCKVENSLNINFSEVEVQTDISLTGEFYLTLLTHRQDEDFILNDILFKHSLAYDIRIQENLHPDTGIISISYHQPLISHSELYSIIYLYVPEIFLSSLKFYQTEQSYNINSPFKVSYSIQGNFQLANSLRKSDTIIDSNWFQFNLNTETDQENSFLHSEFRLDQNTIPIWKTDQIEQMNNILTEQLFIKTLVVRH